MLVLSREPDTSVTIQVPREVALELSGGDFIEIEVKVLQASRHKVRVGVVAPKSVGVWRTEILGRPPARNQQDDVIASSSGSSEADT